MASHYFFANDILYFSCRHIGHHGATRRTLQSMPRWFCNMWRHYRYETRVPSHFPPYIWYNVFLVCSDVRIENGQHISSTDFMYRSWHECINQFEWSSSVNPISKPFKQNTVLHRIARKWVFLSGYVCFWFRYNIKIRLHSWGYSPKPWRTSWSSTDMNMGSGKFPTFDSAQMSSSPPS